MTTVKISPYIDLVSLYLHFLVLRDCRINYIFESRVALKSGLGGVKDAAAASNSHEGKGKRCPMTLGAIVC